MLLKRTGWLQSNSFGDVYTTICALQYAPNLYICREKLEEVFDLPDNVKIRFYLYDRPAKNRVKCRIDQCYLYYLCVGGNRVGIGNYLPKRLIEQLAKRKCLYLECEYVETDTEWS
jgi:hypothetical protein